MAKIKAIRGMNDILPAETPVWQYIETKVASVVSAYGYEEMRMPIVEYTDLFARSIGEVTDIVEKEMYTFADRNDELLTLRPEGTAGCVRACEEHGLLYNQIQRLWYAGPMFRYERPQKGRQRQFHQIGVEAFGMDGPDIDAELILLTARLWEQLGLTEYLTLELNSLGTTAARENYKQALVAFLSERKEQLDEDSQRRLASNPLRILDSKNPQTQELLSDAPMLSEYLDEESQQHFDSLQAVLTQAGIKFKLNNKLVRGLDYYGKTVFEWTTDRLGAQGTVCAGGRYDGLVEQLGGKATTAVGFAMGVERLKLLLEEVNALPEGLGKQVDVIVLSVGKETLPKAMNIAEDVRNKFPALTVQMHCGGGSFKNQMKKADRSGAAVAAILGDDELSDNQVLLKPLRGGDQQRVSMDNLAEVLGNLL